MAHIRPGASYALRNDSQNGISALRKKRITTVTRLEYDNYAY